MTKLWHFFFSLMHNVNHSLSVPDMVAKRLSVTKTEDVLALRDQAYAFINAINDELVKDGRGL